MSDCLEQILTNAASGMSAQNIRMNTIASNLANSGSVGGTEEETYHEKYPIFSEVTQSIAGLNKADQPIGGVRVTEIKKSETPLQKRFEPNNPQANKEGFVFMTDVNPIEEMTNMIATSKAYEANVQIMNTTKDLLMKSLELIK
jgi:flagellar basal-body rod protein FlgC